MIRPQPLAAMGGPNRWPSRNGAVRLTAMVVSQSAMVSWPSGGLRFTPAQLTRMSGSPNAVDRRGGGPVHAGPVAQVGAGPGGVAARRAQPRGAVVQPGGVAGDQEHAGAGPAEGPGDAPADARAAAGDQGHPAGQREQGVEVAAHAATAAGARRPG